MFAFGLLALASFACGLPASRSVSEQGTQAALTVQAVISRTSAALTTEVAATAPGPTATTAAPTFSPPPTATRFLPATTSPAPTLTAVQPSPTQGGCGTNLAAFVTDVTVPDDTIFLPGTAFTKTWRLRNAGTCAWTTAYSLVFDHGDSLGGPPSVPLAGNVPPGATVDLPVNLVAPAAPGTFTGYWKLRSDSGVLFGVGARGDATFFVRIIVQGTSTPTGTASTTPTPTKTPTPSSTPTKTGTPFPPINWDGTYSIRLDTTDSAMFLEQTGSTVVSDATIGGVDYHITGTVSADTLTVSGTFSGDIDGTFFWKMDPGGNQFSGRWVNSADSSTKAWCGARNGAPLPGTCLATP